MGALSTNPETVVTSTTQVQPSDFSYSQKPTDCVSPYAIQPRLCSVQKRRLRLLRNVSSVNIGSFFSRRGRLDEAGSRAQRLVARPRRFVVRSSGPRTS